MKLIIGNKLYSSWSMRPWVLMRALDIPFEEVLIPLDTPETKARREAFAPSGTVPILLDGEIAIWETMAIVEYLAERFPDKPVWPSDRPARAHARVVANEMHAGFQSLRGACPMNFGKRFARRDRGDGVAGDIARIETLFADARSKFGDGGPFLYGAFSAADAMYAPVCARLWGYSFAINDITKLYIDAMFAHPAIAEWRDAGLAEPWTIEADEVDEKPVEVLR